MSAHEVLIIDDNEIDRFILKRNLKSTELELAISEFENGADAIEFLTGILSDQHALPSLIFLDINMPIMNGFEFLAAFQTLLDQHQSTACPVIMYSHSLHPGDQERAEQYAFVDYREKSSLDSGQLKEAFTP